METLRDYHMRAATFTEMAAASPQYGALYSAQRGRAVVPPDLLARVDALGGQWHLLVIGEDWCIDCQNMLPAVSALADAARNFDLRIIGRDAEPELMDAHLTNGSARAIPVIIALDADYQERGWWGSRPSQLQQRVSAEWKQLDKSERNKEIRRWYAIDKGRSTLEAVIGLLEKAALSQSANAMAGA